MAHYYLDAPSLVYRAFFSMPTTVTDPRGRPVNAVRGFMDMVTRLLVDRRPDEVVTTFDNDWRPAFRVDAYAGYKSERPEDPPELPPQFDVLAEVLDAAGIVRAEAESLEADDVLATLMTRKAPEEMAVIVTGDRDLLCLVRDPDVRLLYPVKGLSQVREFDEAAVEEAHGVPPQRYQDFAILRGDPSDGLPGVAGIGPVRAAKLLGEFGSVEGILQNLESLPHKQALAFDKARGYLEAMETVVRLVTDAEVVMTAPGAPAVEALAGLAEAHNLGGSATRLEEALRG